MTTISLHGVSWRDVHRPLHLDEEVQRLRGERPGKQKRSL
jgi:hypothetical protein